MEDSIIRFKTSNFTRLLLTKEIPLYNSSSGSSDNTQCNILLAILGKNNLYFGITRDCERP